jgi:hypothetical protein
MSEELQTQESPQAGAGFADAFDNIDLNWNDDGELVAIKHEDLNNVEEALETLEDETQAQPDEEGSAESASEEEASPEADGNAELEALKAQIAELKEQIKTKEKTPDDQVQPAKQSTIDSLIPEDKDIMDILSDREQGVKFLEDSIHVMLDPLVSALRPMVIQWRVHKEAQELATEHGQDFADRLPLMKTLVQKRPDLTMAQAYDLVKSVPLPKSQAKTGQVEAQDGSAESQGTEQQSVADAKAAALAIAEKADKLRTEQGVAGSRDNKGHATSVKQALIDAVDAHLQNS